MSSYHRPHDLDFAGRNRVEQREIGEWRGAIERIVQHRQRYSPYVADRAISPRERNRAKGRKPLEISGVGGHELAAPCMTVSAVPGSVEGDAEDRTSKAMLRHRARDVRMMMLHADRRHTTAPERI